MGYSLSWLAVKGCPPAEVLTRLALAGTGEMEDFAESELTGAALPGGWYLVVAQHDRLELTHHEVLTRLSTGWGGEVSVLSGMAEEHVMFSSAALWQAGHCLWSIKHDCNKGTFHLEVIGQPPAMFDRIQEDMVTQQHAAGGKSANVDYIFDIPIEVTREMTGYRYDSDVPGLAEPGFEVLARL